MGGGGVNSVARDVHSINGTNPMYLIEKIIRSRIIDTQFWKEKCFALTAEAVVRVLPLALLELGITLYKDGILVNV